jgi:chitodextrinase
MYSYAVAAVDAAGNTSAQTAPVDVTTPAAGATTVLASDNFNRANGGLGPNWTVIDSDPRIVNQQVQETNASDGNDSIPIYTAISWPANQYSQVIIRAATQHAGCSAIVRAKNDPVIEMYFVYVTGPLGPNARLTLAKFVTHVYTELWTSVVRVNAGDLLYLEADGNKLTVKLNGVVLATRTDTSITAAGFAGLDITDYDGQGAPGDGQCDDWEAGAVTGGGGGDTTAPSAPTNLAGSAASSSQINLTWTASTDNVGVTGYKVFRNGTQIATPATPGYSDTNLTPATAYSYAVAAVDAAGNTSTQTTPITVTTQNDTTAPSVPTNLAGSGVSSSQINLTWTASTDNVGVTGYKVFRNGTQIATTPATPGYSDTNLTSSTTYSYAVAAVDAATNTSATTASIDVTTLATGGSTILARDDFNRSNGGLGAAWTVIDSTPRIVNQHVEELNASDGWDSIPIYTGVTWPANQYSQVRVLGATAHAGCSAVVRAKNDTVIDMYFVYVMGPLGPNARLTLAKFVTHNYIELWTNVVPVNAGDVLYLGVRDSTLTVKLNGTVVTTLNDTSITGPGFAGLDITDYDGQGSPGDGQCDDWEGGAIGSVGTPANVAATAISSSQIDLTWNASSADAGIAGYRVYRNGAVIATTANTFYSDTGLALGTTYAYSIATFDTAGNSSALSPPINVTTPGDTIPPSTPANLAGSAASSSRIDLTWSASTDNVAVASYRVYRGGTLIGNPLNGSYSDTGLTPATAYTYSVSALDQAGNESVQSLPVMVTTNAPPSPGAPFVAYAFDDGTGTIAVDESSNHNNGTLINGPTWTAGHSGFAVNLDGVNDYISAGGIVALNGLTAVTVSAWVKGSVGSTSAAGIIAAKDMAFDLLVTGHKAAFVVKSGSTWYRASAATTLVDDGQYHFLAGVYDGAILRIYVDGALEGSLSIGARTLNSPTTALQVGSCAGSSSCDSSGEVWRGAIDDVRVYKRALTASEIVSDMQTPVRQNP